MPKVKRDTPREFRITGAGPAKVTAATGEGEGKKLGTFTGKAYTGAAMKPQGWYGSIVIDLDGVRVPNQHRPALRQHDHEQIVGHTETVKVSNPDGIDVEGVFSGETQHVQKVTVPATNGFQWQMSVGANPIRTEFLEEGQSTTVNGREFTGPLTISRETELGEVSFVPLGADGDTSARVSASKGGRMNFRAMLKASSKFSDEEIDKMSDDEAKAALKECMKGEGEEEGKKEETKAKAKASDEEEKKDEEKKAEARIRQSIAAATQQGIEAGRKAQAAEEQRCAEIRARVNRYGVVMAEVEANGKKGQVNLISHAIQAGWTPDQTELVALRASRANVGPTIYSTTTPEVDGAVLEAAVLHASRHQFKLADDDFYCDPAPDGKTLTRRVPLHLQRETQADLKARYPDQVQQAAHTIFKGRIAPRQIIEAGFRSWNSRHHLDMSGEHGVRDMLRAWEYHENPGIRAEGASSISISNILANVMNKFALQGYLFTEQAWREFCAIRSVTDFKASKSINLLGDVMFKKIGSTGELSNASLADQAFANQAENYGRILTIPWTHLVNDDLGMLTGAPMKIGQGAGLALNDGIWSKMKAMTTSSIKGDDGNDFFRTTSDLVTDNKKYKPNKTTGGGSAFGDTALKTAKALFDNQIDPNGNPLGFDGLTPILLHGPTLWRDVTAQLQAAAIVYGGGSAANAPNINPWQGMLKPVMSRYIEAASYVNSATAWWVLFNPIALAILEVAFLNGVDTPAVLQAGPDFQFDRLGISIRGTMPFGVTQQNFRGGVYNVGA